MIILTLHYKGWDKKLSSGLEQILVYLSQKGDQLNLVWQEWRKDEN